MAFKIDGPSFGQGALSTFKIIGAFIVAAGTTRSLGVSRNTSNSIGGIFAIVVAADDAQRTTKIGSYLLGQATSTAAIFGLAAIGAVLNPHETPEPKPFAPYDFSNLQTLPVQKPAVGLLPPCRTLADGLANLSRPYQTCKIQ